MNSGTFHSGVSVGDVRGAAAVPKRKSDASSARNVQFDQVAVFQWLNGIAADCDNVEQLLKGCSEVVCCQSECLGLWVTQKGEEQTFDKIYSILNEAGGVDWDGFQVIGRRMFKLAASSRQIQISRIANKSNHQLIVVPVLGGASIDLMLAGCFHIQKKVQNEWLMGILAQAVANWFSQRKLAKSEIRARSLTDVVALTSELDKTESMESASLILVNQLKKMAQAQQVAFATAKRDGLPKLMAISDLETVDHSLEATRTTTQACGQAMQLKEIVVYPDRRKEANPANYAPLEQYCKSSGFDACVSVPVMDETGNATGALLLAIPPKQVAENGYINYLSQLGQMLAGHLQVIGRANQSLSEHVKKSCVDQFSSKISKIVGCCVLALCALMIVPWPYKVGCNCEIQPVLRRYIAAPHDGVLERNLVQNGEVIEQDQIVAHLDGRQVRIELAGLEAELAGTKKRRALAMASNQIADAQIALSEIKKLKSQIELANNKLQNLEIRSPIAGIVVAGDLEKVEGAPVEMGQTLFEVGPLDKMLAEIAVPEQDVPYVDPGMKIRIKLNAYPFQTWHGEITRIHPKSEIQEQKSVFIAEVELENKELNLKPGMKGQAKVVSHAYPIGWNLFHHPFEKLRYWMVW